MNEEEFYLQGEIWASDIKIIFRTIAGKWPDSVLEFRSGDVQLISEVKIKRKLIQEDWHHIFKSRESLDSWDANGWTPENGTDLITINIGDDVITFSYEGKRADKIVREAAANVFQHRKNKLQI